VCFIVVVAGLQKAVNIACGIASTMATKANQSSSQNVSGTNTNQGTGRQQLTQSKTSHQPPAVCPKPAYYE